MPGDFFAQAPPVLVIQPTPGVFVLEQKAWAGVAKTWSCIHLVHLPAGANSRYSQVAIAHYIADHKDSDQPKNRLVRIFY